MEVAIHTIFEVPEVAGRDPLSVSVWVCFGPFDDADKWHAEDHPDSIRVATRVPLEVAEEVAKSIQQILHKVGVESTSSRYPGD